MTHDEEQLATTSVGREFLRELSGRADPASPDAEAYAVIAEAAPLAVDESVFAARVPDDPPPTDRDLAWARRIARAAEFSAWWGRPDSVVPQRALPAGLAGADGHLAESTRWELGPVGAAWVIHEVPGLRPTLEALAPRLGLARNDQRPAHVPQLVAEQSRLLVIDTAEDWLELCRTHGQVIDLAGKEYWPDWAPRWGVSADDQIVVPGWPDLAAAGILGVHLSPGGYLHLEGTAPRDGSRVCPLVGWAPSLTVVLG